MVKIGIIGATGYTGLELLKILARHPAAEIAWLTSENSAGQRFGDVFPVPPLPRRDDPGACRRCRPGGRRRGLLLPAPRGRAGAGRRGPAAGARVIDLSADYRLHDAARLTRPGTATRTCEPDAAGRGRLRPARAAPGRDRPARTWWPIPAATPPASSWAWRRWLRPAGCSGTVIADSKSGVSGAGPLALAQDPFRRSQREPEPVQHRPHAPPPGRDGAGAGPAGRAPANGAGPCRSSSRRTCCRSTGASSRRSTSPCRPASTEAEVREAYGEAYAGEPFVHVLQAGPGGDAGPRGQHQLLRHRPDVRAGHERC